ASESTATIALFDTAATRAVWFCRFVHASLPLAFSWTYVPTTGFVGRFRMAERLADARCMARFIVLRAPAEASGVSAARSLIRSARSNAAPKSPCAAAFERCSAPSPVWPPGSSCGVGVPVVAIVPSAASDTDARALIVSDLKGTSTYSLPDAQPPTHSVARSEALRTCGAPTASASGVTPEHEVDTAGTTTMVVCADLEPLVAVMTADPAATPVTTPPATVATPVADDCQLNETPLSVPPVASRPVAATVVVCPTAIVFVA